MEVLMAIVHLIVILGIAFLRNPESDPLRRFYWPALSLKLACGVCLGMLYKYYYPVADTFAYFSDASKIAAVAAQDFSAYVQLLLCGTPGESLGLAFSEPRAVFLSKLISAVNLITGNNYWATGFYFSFASFQGTWLLVRVIRRNIPEAGTAAVAAFLFLPSVVFWTSGLLKESLAMATLFFLASIFLKVWFNEKISWWQVALSICSLWIFWNLKYYYAGVFIAVACTTLGFKFFVRRRDPLPPGAEALIWLAMLLAPLAIVSFLHPNFHVDRLLNVIVENNEAYNRLSSPDNLVHFRSLQPSPWSILLNAPWALFSGLFRPVLWEVESLIQLFAALENTAFLVLSMGSIMNMRPSEGVSVYFKPRHRLLILSAMVYVVVLGVLLTMSAPNFGTLSRYRTGFISFFVFIVLCNNPIVVYVERWLRKFVSK